jgi:hypothetical protein
VKKNWSTGIGAKARATHRKDDLREAFLVTTYLEKGAMLSLLDDPMYSSIREDLFALSKRFEDLLKVDEELNGSGCLSIE